MMQGSNYQICKLEYRIVYNFNKKIFTWHEVQKKATTAYIYRIVRPLIYKFGRRW